MTSLHQWLRRKASTRKLPETLLARSSNSTFYTGNAYISLHLAEKTNLSDCFCLSKTSLRRACAFDEGNGRLGVLGEEPTPQERTPRLLELWWSTLISSDGDDWWGNPARLSFCPTCTVLS
jgi:hypothetical protein